MNKNYDLNNDNNADNNKCIVQYELKESENVKKSEDITKEEENKFFNMKNFSNSDTNNTFNKILIETNDELDNDSEIRNKTTEENKFDQKNNEHKNEINNYSDNEINIVNKTIKEKNAESDQANNKHENNDIYNRLSRIIDSDSEEEIFTFNSNKNKSTYNKSEDEMSSSEYDKSHLKNKDNTMKLFDSDTNDNILNQTDTEEIISNKKKITNNIRNRFQTLIDSESDEERKDDKEPLNPIKHGKTKKCKEEYSKVRKVSLRASKEEAMKQIHSETQRLIRETEISLPYHKPKQRTLQEFLNRKKVITALPKAPTMAAKLKMSSIIVDEVLKEKEKEAEIFYKSSDSEDEIREINKENIDKEYMNIKYMQDVKKNNVSRKLFIDNNLSILENNEEKNDIMEEISETITETKEIEYNKTNINDKTEENRTNLKIAEIHCEFNKIENKNIMSTLNTIETTKNEKEDYLLQTDSSQNKNKEENVYTDNNKYDSEIVNEHSDISTSKNNNDYARIVKQSLGITTDESDEYNEYGLPPPKFDESPDIIKKKTLINVKGLEPKLRGIPGTVIDLSDNIKPSKKGISALIDRFICKHSKTKEHINDIKLTAMQIKESSNGLSIIKETLPYRSLSNIANEDAKLEKPGAKLKRLKEELKQKMVLKRNEEWKQKEEEMKEQEIEWNESINEEDNFNEPYSPSIESHRTEEDELEEDELEEDDIYIKKEKKKKKNIFMDDEAEVSENEINDSDEIEDEDEDEDEENSEKDEIYEKLISENEDENSNCDSNEVSTKHKTFKRILKSLDDDSKSSIIENNKNIENETSFPQITLDDKNFKENELSDNENDIPVFQIHTKNDSEYQNQTPKIKKSNTLDFISPITQLTALNAHVEEENELITEEVAETRDLFHQMRDDNKQVILQRKLFVSQDNVLDEDLMEICSGKFPDDKFICSKFAKEPNISETQLLELCSGTFNSQSNDKELIDRDELFQNTEISDEKNCSYYETDKKDKEQSKEETISWNKFRILSSDEEDLVEEKINKKSKKRIKKLNLSDDEENSSAISSNDEHDEKDDEKFIDYDSEENEIIIPKKDIKQYAAKFLEEEAELSESDCDVSADEDEQDLDKLEFEDGDNEEIDETKVKNQIGKLHMRQLLDEDQREVRMLQELLFEDGDLFSESTRERKFKWRNIDKQDDNDNSQPLEDKDGWVDLSDDEDEAKWRKIRHEREKFLAEKMKNVDTEIEDELNSSKIFKFGLKILKKRRIDESQKQNTLVEALDSEPKLKIPYTITEILNTSELNQTSRTIHNVMQKRSFLAKGEETLTRLAALAKRKETPLSTINAKNFVFTHVDVNTEDENISIAKKTQRKEIKNKINKKN